MPVTHYKIVISKSTSIYVSPVILDKSQKTLSIQKIVGLFSETLQAKLKPPFQIDVFVKDVLTKIYFIKTKKDLDLYVVFIDEEQD